MSIGLRDRSQPSAPLDFSAAAVRPESVLVAGGGRASTATDARVRQPPRKHQLNHHAVRSETKPHRTTAALRTAVDRGRRTCEPQVRHDGRGGDIHGRSALPGTPLPWVRGAGTRRSRHHRRPDRRHRLPAGALALRAVGRRGHQRLAHRLRAWIFALVVEIGLWLLFWYSPGIPSLNDLFGFRIPKLSSSAVALSGALVIALTGAVFWFLEAREEWLAYRRRHHVDND